ncbi:hypothetical protein MMC17_006490 [Xylographa soralifera]|nr:hypothetical protein [Xylographa soralifera]
MDWRLFSNASRTTDRNMCRRMSLASGLARASVMNIMCIALTSLKKRLGSLRDSRRQESLAALVARHRRCHATDPRDKIFALLGVSESVSAEAFPVDYTQSTAAIYTEFALYTMREEASIDILSSCSLASTNVPCVTLPSWVPDWTRDFQNGFGPPEAFTHYHAADNIACSFRLGENLNMLLVDRLLMSQVAHVCPSSTYGSNTLDIGFYEHYSPGEVVQILEARVDIFRNATVTATDSQIYSRKKEYPKHLVQALTAYSNRQKNIYINIEADVVNLYFKYLSWTQRVVMTIRDGQNLRNDPELVVTDELIALALEIDRLQGYNNFCRFTDGHIGWVPKQAVVGDQIAIFLGAHVPMLLRPHNDAYIIVGESYVYEMMDGEALEDPSLKVESIKLV